VFSTDALTDENIFDRELIDDELTTTLRSSGRSTDNVTNKPTGTADQSSGIV